MHAYHTHRLQRFFYDRDSITHHCHQIHIMLTTLSIPTPFALLVRRNKHTFTCTHTHAQVAAVMVGDSITHHCHQIPCALLVIHMHTGVVNGDDFWCFKFIAFVSLAVCEHELARKYSYTAHIFSLFGIIPLMRRLPQYTSVHEHAAWSFYSLGFACL